jgi:hypothetical protein
MAQQRFLANCEIEMVLPALQVLQVLFENPARQYGVRLGQIVERKTGVELDRLRAG